jgi:CheY-like chemotaxis protein
MNEKTILVIEDNDLNMKLIRTLLELKNYQTIEAVDAENGIQLAREYHPDLILMDIQLPGIDGLTATRLIKNDSAMKDIPVVALTGDAILGDDEKTGDAGFASYLAKPIDTRSFLESIARFLS